MGRNGFFELLFRTGGAIPISRKKFWFEVGSFPRPLIITTLLTTKNKQFEIKKPSKFRLEQSLNRLKTDLKSSKFHETELRTQLTTSQQQEKSAKQELLLLRAKHDQIETKYKQLSKQSEQQKSTMTLLEKRLVEIQARKNELEKELLSEKNYTKVIKEEPNSKVG